MGFFWQLEKLVIVQVDFFQVLILSSVGTRSTVLLVHWSRTTVTVGTIANAHEKPLCIFFLKTLISLEITGNDQTILYC